MGCTVMGKLFDVRCGCADAVARRDIILFWSMESGYGGPFVVRGRELSEHREERDKRAGGSEQERTRAAGWREGWAL